MKPKANRAIYEDIDKNNETNSKPQALREYLVFALEVVGSLINTYEMNIKLRSLGINDRSRLQLECVCRSYVEFNLTKC
jgi:hypothetical protein